MGFVDIKFTAYAALFDQVKYKVDAIDESDIIEDILKSGVQKFDGSLTKITIDGNHITPCVQVFFFCI